MFLDRLEAASRSNTISTGEAMVDQNDDGIVIAQEMSSAWPAVGECNDKSKMGAVTAQQEICKATM